MRPRHLSLSSSRRGAALASGRGARLRALGPCAARLILLALALTAPGIADAAPDGEVAGGRGLPEAAWEEDALGRRAVVALASAPFPAEGFAHADPSVLLFVPRGFDPNAPFALVVHLHGYWATLARTVPRQRLLEQHALSGRNAVLVVPQGPVDAASGDFGKLEAEGGFAALHRDVLALLRRDGVLTRAAPDQVVLTTHSGGYRALMGIITLGGVPIDGAHLHDGLYRLEAEYRDYARVGGRLRSSSTTWGGTRDDNEALMAMLDAAGVAYSDRLDDVALLGSRVNVGPVRAYHHACIWTERAFARWLAHSGLPPRPDAPPQLRSVVVSPDGQAAARWLPDGAGPRRVRVQGSSDGERWQTLTETDDVEATVPAHPWLRLVALNPDGAESAPSDRYAASGARWLIVDGFDRVLGGSWREPTHDFAARLGAHLPGGASTVDNDAVARGEVRLDDFDRVLWMLGDESHDDRTLDDEERAALAGYLARGGRLILTGAEVAHATDPDWLAAHLHVALASDSARTDRATGYTFGVAYPEDFPDVLTPLDDAQVLWRYATGGAAAVGHANQLAVVGFPLETLAPADLPVALAELAAWLEPF